MNIFHSIKSIFVRPALLPGSCREQLSRKMQFLHACIAFGGGVITATAFPPLNMTVSVFFGLAILFLTAQNKSPWRAAWAGWLWGMGYALCSFFWLREINPAIPWMMMVVLGAYYIPVGWTAAIAKRYILLPAEIRAQGFEAQKNFRNFTLLRQLAWCLVTASSVVLVEYLRHTVLPWNYLGAAFYRNAVMMQTVRFTGIAGLTMLAALINCAVAMAVLTVSQKDPEHGHFAYRRPWPLLIMLVILAMMMAGGVVSLRERRKEYNNFTDEVRLTLVQGNLSQRRYGGEKSAYEALETYTRLTRTQRGVPTDLVVWPETAINYPLRGGAMVCALYRAIVQELSKEMKSPLLLGTLEFDTSTNPPGSLNSAVLTDTRDVLRSGYRAIYSKVHPVPFGEFVPMRRYLPDWVIKIIDMQRDLTPGKSMEPISLNEKVRLGVNICFEDVFPYISRREQLLGANLLLVITNDAWYPTSSEPEQHLANAVSRAVETGLPMVRCGNDSATCLITPAGEIIWSLAETLKFDDGKPFRRGAGAATITVNVPSAEQNKITFYSRYRDWIVGVAAITWLCGMLSALMQRVKFLRKGN